MPSYENVLSNMSPTDYIHDAVQFVIDDNLRTISVPSIGRVAGVVGDKDTNYINFKMGKYYNGIDLSSFTPAIYYENANGRVDKYTVTDLTIEDTTMLFTWLISEDVTAYPGEVRFSINLSKYNGTTLVKSFNTSFATLKVLDTIDYDNYIAAENTRQHDKSEFGNLVCFADSIGQGQNNNNYSYIDILQETGRFNSVTKAAVGSATFGTYSGVSADPILKWAVGSSFYDQVRKSSYANAIRNADNIIVQYMANDVLAVLGGYATIGSPTDTGTSTMCGMIKNSLNHIRSLNPDAVITWVGLFNTTKNLAVYANAYFGISNSYNLGYTYTDIYNTAHSINEAARTIFTNYNCNIVPILEGKPVNEYNVNSFFSSDNVHPNTTGHKLIAKQIMNTVRGGQEISWAELDAKLSSGQSSGDGKTAVITMTVDQNTMTSGTTDMKISDVIALHNQGYVIRGMCNLLGIDLIFHVNSVFVSQHYVTLSTNAVTMGASENMQIMFTAVMYNDYEFHGVQALDLSGLITNIPSLLAVIGGA